MQDRITESDSLVSQVATADLREEQFRKHARSHWHGYIFILAITVVVFGATWGLWSVRSAVDLGFVAAITFAVWLTIWRCNIADI
jgi:hypothetical protein